MSPLIPLSKHSMCSKQTSPLCQHRKREEVLIKSSRTGIILPGWSHSTPLTFVLYVGCPLREETRQRRTLGREGEAGNCACLLVSRGRQRKETGYNPWVSKSRQLIYFSPPIFRFWFAHRTRNLFKVSLLKGLKCKKIAFQSHQPARTRGT